ncbi:MAG: YggS family pyridoxal phosphate-dependent enzyme [Clostridia bacterium]|nr:YggS family pyridoxal phosphate-dependent enzyme [Clostridia bacterium]
MEFVDLSQRVETVRANLASASGGKYPVPKLIAVTKTHPVEAILPLQKLGIVDVGENRTQEIVEKREFLKENFQIHLIGRLQSNKVKYIIEDVCLIHSLDRMSLAEEINRQAQMHEKVMPVLVQVSPAGEEQKGGMPPEAVLPFLREAAKMPGLQIRGLMAVMPLSHDEQYLSGLFADMRILFERLRSEAVQGVAMEELSMGMSGDYLLAARHGATMVRVGSAIFGPRA